MSAGAQYRMRRRLRFARQAAAAAAANEVPPPPDGNSVQVMRHIDPLPGDVRELIYEYGLTAVAAFVNEGLRGADLAVTLAAYRRGRQEQLLQADYFLRRGKR